MRAGKNKIIIGLGFLLSLRLQANGCLKYSIQYIYCLRFQAKGGIKYSI